jgi:hypothetical protein
MTSESRHISEWIDRPADEVYEYALDPANMPQWAPGLGSSVEKVDDQWFVETSEGRVGFAFVRRNEYGVLDHYVTLPLGEVVYNPLRVIEQCLKPVDRPGRGVPSRCPSRGLKQ